MKAWFVWCGDWGDYVHGETRNQAKSMFWREWANEAEEWILLRPIRFPRLDDVPITEESILAFYRDSEDLYKGWTPICKCSICKPESE